MLMLYVMIIRLSCVKWWMFQVLWWTIWSCRKVDLLASCWWVYSFTSSCSLWCMSASSRILILVVWSEKLKLSPPLWLSTLVFKAARWCLGVRQCLAPRRAHVEKNTQLIFLKKWFLKLVFNIFFYIKA